MNYMPVSRPSSAMLLAKGTVGKPTGPVCAYLRNLFLRKDSKGASVPGFYRSAVYGVADILPWRNPLKVIGPIVCLFGIYMVYLSGERALFAERFGHKSMSFPIEICSVAAEDMELIPVLVQAWRDYPVVAAPMICSANAPKVAYFVGESRDLHPSLSWNFRVNSHAASPAFTYIKTAI